MKQLISRRDVIRYGFQTSAGLMLANCIRAYGAETLPPAVATKAKCVIQIWLWGGPCHLDTFDPKPGAGSDFSGPFDKPIATNVDGMQINELMPILATQADKYSLIRSMTHGSDGHETAAYMVQTGRKAGDGLVWPSVGAVVSLHKGQSAGYKGMVPPYIVLTEPQGRFSEAGFLGERYKPFATGGDPSAAQFVVEGIVAQGITEERQRARRDLLGNLNTLGNALDGNAQVKASEQAKAEAYELILGEEGRMFDLSKEPDDVRLAYGRTKFGQSCLMARRLVEKGIPYITINHGGWDTHKDHFPAMRRKLPELDRGLGTLLKELAERGLLESTIVWCCGEFGRTPKVAWEAPWSGGRHHYGRVFSALVAGGGFKGGQVVGSSDEKGQAVKDRPVYPADLLASMYQKLGIDPSGKLPHPQGKPTLVTPAASENMPTGGVLKEIM